MKIFSALLALCAVNSPVTGEFPSQGQRSGALMFSLICAWINNWLNNSEDGYLRRHQAHYDVTVLLIKASPNIRLMKENTHNTFLQRRVVRQRGYWYEQQPYSTDCQYHIKCSYHWCAIVIAPQLLWQNVGAPVFVLQESPLVGEPRKTVSHPQRPPLRTLYKISLPVYVIVTNKQLQPSTTTWYNSLVLYYSFLKIWWRLIIHRIFCAPCIFEGSALCFANGSAEVLHAGGVALKYLPT